MKTPFKLISLHSPLLSFLGHPKFYPAYTEPVSFQAWVRAGLTRICDLVNGNTIKSFPSTQAQTQLPSRECFRYLQIAHFVQTTIKSLSGLDTLTEYETMCDSDPHAPGAISRLYAHLTTLPSSLPTYAQRWLRDLNVNIDAEDWGTI